MEIKIPFRCYCFGEVVTERSFGPYLDVMRLGYVKLKDTELDAVEIRAENYEELIRGMKIFANHLRVEVHQTGGDDGTDDYFPGAWEGFHYLCKKLNLKDLFDGTRKYVTENNSSYDVFKGDIQLNKWEEPLIEFTEDEVYDEEDEGE